MFDMSRLVEAHQAQGERFDLVLKRDGVSLHWTGDSPKLDVRCKESRLSGIGIRRRLTAGSTTSDLIFVIIGMSSERKLLVAVHPLRGARIRIINARLATRHERRNYEETPL